MENGVVKMVESALEGQFNKKMLMLDKIQRVSDGKTHGLTKYQNEIVSKFLDKCMAEMSAVEWTKALSSPNGLLMRLHAVTSEEIYAYALITAEKPPQPHGEVDDSSQASSFLQVGKKFVIENLQKNLTSLSREERDAAPDYMNEIFPEKKLQHTKTRH